MSDNELQKAINRWRSLPMEERQRRHLEAIPRHVANSMAMAGEPVDEVWLRERLARRIRHHSLRFSVDGTTRRNNHCSRVQERIVWFLDYFIPSLGPMSDPLGKG